MYQKLYGGWLVLTTAALGLSAPASFGQATDTTYDYPGRASDNVPIPTGRPGTHGFYTFGEFRFLTQNWTLGNQPVAVRGFYDSAGQLTGVPGTFVGSGQVALSTDQLGRSSYNPGYVLGLGYKLDDGTSVYASISQMMDHTYSAGASLVPQGHRFGVNLADSFITAPVFNFTPDYSGPVDDTNLDIDPNFPSGNAYGIWNAATVMDIAYTTRFVTAEIGARVPLFQSEYSRIYGMAGGRYAWFWERFSWRTVNADVLGTTFPSYTANYEASMSQRMYGPFIGCGHEVYMGRRFSLSMDLSAAALMNLIKTRAKYELGDETTQNKRSRNDFQVTPNVNADINLWWYPIEGVQMRFGYSALTFFNTQQMQYPIDFNYGAIDPGFDRQYFRIVHGFNVGVGLFF